jgi:murein DD-endopeptidase MepM/ murein hydrolase activator NlpD
MKNIYYFSKEKLQYVEIKNLKPKLILLFSCLVIVLCLIVFSAGNLFAPRYKTENEALREKVDEILTLYKNLNVELDSLTTSNNSLRLAANLQPISKDELLLGVGGGSFDNSIDFIPGNKSLKLKDAINFADEVSRKISFEKSQFNQIRNQLKSNEKLYQSLPAIKPCPGDLSSQFGRRMHPILHLVRMHDGIDIVTNVGTPVHSAANGIVEFVGYNGGFGLSVVVNHGFGYRTRYAHLSKVNVKRNQKVKRGDIIALTGNTGLSTGPHLHYEIEHNGTKLDPEHFFFKKFRYFDAIAKK